MICAANRHTSVQACPLTLHIAPSKRTPKSGNRQSNSLSAIPNPVPSEIAIRGRAKKNTPDGKPSGVCSFHHHLIGIAIYGSRPAFNSVFCPTQ